MATEEEQRLRQLIANLQNQNSSLQNQNSSLQNQNASLQRQQQDTTFQEMLESYHQCNEKLLVETNKKLTTQGGTTDPKGRRCPMWIRKWTNFPALRDNAFDRVQAAIKTDGGEDPRLFKSKLFIEELVLQETGRKMTSELDLGLLLHNLLDVPAAAVATFLAREWSLGEEVVFGNHGNFEQEMVALQEKRKRIPADRECRLRLPSGEMRPICIIEHKPPHKVTKDTIFNGLDQEIKLDRHILNRATSPTDPHENFVYTSQIMVASVMTQVYNYMLRSGLQYGCVTTGETMAFLFIDEEDTNTLYYHLTDPLDEVQKESEARGPFPFAFTAVAQMVEILALALYTKPRGQEWRDHALGRALTWEADPDQVLRDCQEQQQKIEKPSSVYKCRVKAQEQRTPYKTRSYMERQPRRPMDIPSPEERRKSRSDSDDDDDHHPYDTPSRQPQKSRHDNGNGRQRAAGSGSSNQDSKSKPQSKEKPRQQTRSYCTQACLLGLVRRLPFDPSCPNVALHRQPGCSTSSLHAITLPNFTTAVRTQLGRSLVAGVSNLQIHGRRGALFRIELLSHGYVFVAKACIDLLADSLRHEGRVYDRLADLQADLIPVYLGNIDLSRPWWEKHYELRHMLLMSHAGRSIVDEDDDNEKVDPKITRDATKAYKQRCREMGVYNKDMHEGNMLWNEERGAVMFVDLEDVVLFEPGGGRQNLSTERNNPVAPLERKVLRPLQGTNRGQRIPNFESRPAHGRKRKYGSEENLLLKEEEEEEEFAEKGRKTEAPDKQARGKRLRTIDENGENKVVVEEGQRQGLA